jgi:hypothetical protein
MNDLDRFITDPDHQASANGWVESPLIGGRRSVENGIVNLLVSDADPTYKEMRYRLFFTDDKGAPLTLTGVKNIHDDGGFDIWPDTTTLYTTILPGTVKQDDASIVPVAAGIIRIHWDDFLQQLTAPCDGRYSRSDLTTWTLMRLSSAADSGARLQRPALQMLGIASSCSSAGAGGVSRISRVRQTVRGSSTRKRRSSGTAGSTFVCFRTWSLSRVPVSASDRSCTPTSP